VASADRLIGLAYLLPLGEGAAEHDRGRGWRWMGEAGHGPAPLRPGPPHVARFGPDDAEGYPERARKKGIADLGTEAIEAGAIKTFPCLALDACDDDGHGGWLGRPMLAMLKGDVDRLGRIFAHGLGPEWSLTRTAALSRMIDLYFTLRLPALLATEFPDTYTLYAGGDDFVLIAPWRQGLALARRLREDFRAFAGGNPDLTFSLGIALFDPRTPVATAAREAEARLDAAKAAGRDRISAIEDTPMTWDRFAQALDAAEAFNAWLRDGTLATSAVYRLLALDEARRRVVAGRGRGADHGWRAKLAYHLARLRPAHGEGKVPVEVFEACRNLFGIGPDWKAPPMPPPGLRLTLSHALYRNR
jgi:CRISPR-associated protein Csm1